MDSEFIKIPLNIIYSDKLSLRAKILYVYLASEAIEDNRVFCGVREAAVSVPCNKNTAAKAFKDLVKSGFIECASRSGRMGSRPREWRLKSVHV
ncbi:MAG: hypothetical protein KJ725_14430 [Gammaproteobacteria bacterium]|nr:hypothetical protein [Gammaproteobacteria bacterium]